MEVTEIILLVLGILVFVLSFLVPADKTGRVQEQVQIDEDKIKEIIDREVTEAQSRIRDIADEAVTYSIEKTERSMERLTNEKIMAVNEYSDTVLEQIKKNHKETVFLYDMLNEKHENLKETVSEVNKTVTEVKQTVKEAEFMPMKLAKAEHSENVHQQPVQEDVMISGQMTEAQEMTEATPVIHVQTEEKTKRKTTRKTKTEEVKTVHKDEKNEKAEKAGKVDLSSIATPEKGGRNSNERILKLHNEGKSNMAIAKELGLGIGEVKLVIDLFEGI